MLFLYSRIDKKIERIVDKMKIPLSLVQALLLLLSETSHIHGQGEYKYILNSSRNAPPIHIYCSQQF